MGPIDLHQIQFVESLVFAKIVAEEINKNPIKKIDNVSQTFIKTYKEKTRNKIRAKKYIWQLRSSMMRNLGIVRNSQSIIRGLKDILRIERESKGLSAKLNDMILVSKFIIAGAYKRKESRGCHLRSDYIAENDKFKLNIDQDLKSMELDIQKILETAQLRVDDKHVAL